MNAPGNTSISKNNLLNRISGLFYRYNWHCAVIAAPIAEVALGKSQFKVAPILKPEAKVLRADPFGCIIKGTSYLFFEEQRYKGKGSIICYSAHKSKVVLKATTHYSYPYLFTHTNQVYCVPEQHETNRVDLYKFNERVVSLEFYKTMLTNFAAADPTLLEYHGRWWMFCTDNTTEGANSRLHLFYAETLDGNWIPHPMNPIKNSTAGARPAGTPFMHNDKLYRPGQNSTHTYGGSILIFEITNLTETEYAEKLVNELLPAQFGEGNSGIHTIAALGNQTLIDLKQKVFSLRNLLQLLRKK